jgi:uncharacterized membrane protein
MAREMTPDERQRRAMACRKAQWVMIVDAIVGLCLALYAYYVLNIPGLAFAGLLVMIGGVLMAGVFWLMGQRARMGGKRSPDLRQR